MTARLVFYGALEAQSWETFVDRVSDRYARHGGLERWVGDDAAWADLERQHAERIRRVGRLDLARRRIGEDIGPDASVVTIMIVGALAVSLWDEARRLAGEPEMMMLGQRRTHGAAFASLEEALAFFAYGTPAEEDRASPAPIGMVSRGWVREGEPGAARTDMRLVVAQDRDEDVRERRRAEAKGYDLPAGPRRVRREPHGGPLPVGGFLPVEWLPARGSRSGGARAAGAALVELLEDLRSGAAAAGLWGEPVLESLVDVHVGRWMPVPRRRRVGDAGDRRGRHQVELVRWTVGDVAIERCIELDAARAWLRVARRSLRREWVLRGLVPTRDVDERDAVKEHKARVRALFAVG